MSLFESSLTGNILDDGRTTEVTGITAGQLATVLTAYTPLTDTAANTAAIGVNSAAAAGNAATLTAQAAQLDGKLDSAALGPALTPYALAADLAAAQGLIAANASGVTALNTSLTAGLATKADQSALDALQVVVASKATPESVDTRLQAFSTTAAMNSAITSSANTTLAATAAAYALKTVVDQLALDLAAKQTGPDVDQKVATALLPLATAADVATTVGTATALRTTPADVDQKIATALLAQASSDDLAAAVALRTTPADVAQLIATALLPYVQQAQATSPAEVAQLIATALLPYVEQATLDAALALRDTRLDALDADVLALQGAGPFASSADLAASEAALQSAIDAVLAQLAALSTGGGSNLINAQAWPGEVTWDLLLGTNTLRNLHVSAPLGIALANDNFTLSLSCDAYSTAAADAASASAIAVALVPYDTAAERDAAVAAALLPYGTATERDAAIAAALLPYGTATERDAAIAAALLPYGTAAERAAAIAAALLPYGTAAERDAAIAAALAAYSTTGDMNAAIAAALGAVDLSDYYTPAEVNAVVTAAIDALNADQYQTEAEVDAAVADALVPYYTATQTDAAISASSGLTLAQGDARYFPVNGNTEGGSIYTLVMEAFTPRVVRALTATAPASLTPILNAGATLNIEVDSWSKAEADSRYFSNTDFSALDSRYLTANAHPGGGDIYPMVFDGFIPRSVRALLCTAPLSATPILSAGVVLQLQCDCYSKSESDAKYLTAAAADAAYADLDDVAALDVRVTALEAETLPDDIVCVSLTASSHVSTPQLRAPGDWLEVRAGTAGTRLEDASGTGWATLTASQAFFAVPLRVDGSLTVDTASGPDLGVYTAAVRARTGEALLTLTGGTAGLRAEGALEITGITTGTQAVFPTSVATAQLAPSPSTSAYLTLVSGLTGTEVVDQSLSPLLRVEDEETKVSSRLLSVTRSGPAAGVVGAVLKNTAPTGYARLQLDANNSTGLAEVQVLATGGFQVNALGQTMALNNQAGMAPLVIATNGGITSNYSFADLSDTRIKTNLREAEPEQLAAAFDGLQALWYDRTDCPQKDRLGFVAQDVQALGPVGEALTGSATLEDGTELVTLDYARLSCVLWGAVKRLQERVAALERKKRR